MAPCLATADTEQYWRLSRPSGIVESRNVKTDKSCWMNKRFNSCSLAESAPEPSRASLAFIWANSVFACVGHPSSSSEITCRSCSAHSGRFALWSLSKRLKASVNNNKGPASFCKNTKGSLIGVSTSTVANQSCCQTYHRANSQRACCCSCKLAFWSATSASKRGSITSCAPRHNACPITKARLDAGKRFSSRPNRE